MFFMGIEILQDIPQKKSSVSELKNERTGDH